MDYQPPTSETIKTSEEWQQLCRAEILDPDGWDRKNFQHSWYEEKITKLEFEKRLIQSTILLSDIMSIWRDSLD